MYLDTCVEPWAGGYDADDKPLVETTNYWLRRQASVLLVCGQGQWEDTTGALDSTKRFGALLAEKGIPHEVDLWGHDVPHDWPSWRRQLAHHLPRFVA